MKNIFKTILAVAVSALAGSAIARADNFDPRSMSMAGANLVGSRSVEGALANPANLGLSGNSGFGLKLFYFGTTAVNNSFNLNDYNRVSGDTLDDSEKTRLLDAIPISGFVANTSMDALLFGLSTGRMALAVNLKSAERICLPRDVFDLVLFGNQLDRTYDLAGENMGDVWTVAVTTLSYGQPIDIGLFKKLSLGIGVKHLLGINYGRAGGEIMFTTGQSGFRSQGSFEILTAGEDDFTSKKLNMNGSGLGLDLGLACQINDHWSLSFSGLDLNNGITWNNGTRQRTAKMELGELVLLGDSISALMSQEDLMTETESSGMVFKSRFPSTVNAGIAFSSRLIEAELNMKRGFYDGAGSSSNWQLSSGLELRLLSFLPLRAGLGIRDSRTIAYSAGAGLRLGFFRLDAAATTQGYPGNSARGLGAALSAGMEFGE